MQWMTSFGWRNRGRMDSLEVNRHPLCPDASKVAELMIVSIWLRFLRDDSRCILPLKGGILSVHAKIVAIVGISASLDFAQINFGRYCIAEPAGKLSSLKAA